MLRIVVPVCFGVILAVFALGQTSLGLQEDATLVMACVGQLGGPLLAALCCVHAGRLSSGGDRRAWQSFAAGSGLYLLGNLCYLVYTLAGITPSFPAAPEAAYFVMAGFFGIGISLLGRRGARLSRVHIYNFVLIYCAVVAACFFIFSPHLRRSVMGEFPTIVALLYPALWFSVAAYGLIIITLSRLPRPLPYALILGAVLAEAGADFLYSLALMEGTYQLGGMTQLLWVASACLICWAAVEYALDRRAGEMGEGAFGAERGALAQALIPAAAIGIILLSASISGAFGQGVYGGFATVMALAFAGAVGLREYWIIHSQRRLQRVVEGGRNALTESKRQLTAVLQSTTDCVLVADRDWKISFLNDQARKMLAGIDVPIGLSLWTLMPGEQYTDTIAAYKRAMATGKPEQFEVYYHATQSWVHVHAYPSSEGLSIFFRDISEDKKAREEISHMAHHDPLTGLANRTLLQKELKQVLAGGEAASILLIDLDHFKEVNDTLGHPVGDALLVSTAQRLRQTVPEPHVIARLGGDEFAIVLVGMAEREAVTSFAWTVLDALSEPHAVEGRSLRIDASIGIALNGEEIVDPDQLFRRADIALYAAKGEMRGAFRIFEPAMEEGLHERQKLRTDLAIALVTGQFELYYQPIIDLASDRIGGFEALVRWRHPEAGMIAPDVFIPLAEETGLILPLGEWVLRTACAQAAKWPAGVSISVNLSTCQFQQDGLADTVAAVLAETGLASERLILEITESVLLNDTHANVFTLAQIRDLGVGIALDDFGTGYSALGYLLRFQFSKIKIDRSFIVDLPDSEEAKAVVGAVVGLARSLHLRITVEGVESEAQYAWIKQSCDEAQGFLLSRPVPVDGVGGLMDKFGVVEAGGKRKVG